MSRGAKGSGQGQFLSVGFEVEAVETVEGSDRGSCS